MPQAERILVTGADGFIGSHVVESLVREGFSVRAFVHYNSFNSWGWLDECDPSVRGSFEVFSGDVRDPHGVREAMRGCGAVLHLAALIAIPYSYHSPSSYVETNVTGTLNVVQAARDLDVGRVIHTSTSEVYGTAQFVPITEEHCLQGQSPYSATKIGADQIALSFYRSFGTPVAVLRPFNTYGPRQSARAVIPTIITQLACGKRALRLGALHPTRDFSYVTDTAAAFLAALRARIDEIAGQVLNVGSNFEVSIGETVERISALMNVEAEVVTEELRMRPERSEVYRLWCDNTKMRQKTGWTPAFAGREGFDRGLQETIRWFTDEQNLRRYKPEIYNV